MIDVDHFKRFNDRFGHEAGDQVLKHVAEALQQQTRDGDILARFGGEEFVVLLPGIGMSDAIARAEGLRMAVKRLTLQHGAERRGTVTVSIGVASYPEIGASFPAVIQAADDAMYCAKRAGRDRVEQAALTEPAAAPIG